MRASRSTVRTLVTMAAVILVSIFVLWLIIKVWLHPGDIYSLGAGGVGPESSTLFGYEGA